MATEIAETISSRIIRHVRENPGQTTASIAVALGVKASSTASHATQLFRRGYLTRSMSEDGIFVYAASKRLPKRRTAKANGAQSFDLLVTQLADQAAARDAPAFVARYTEQLRKHIKQGLAEHAVK